MKLEDVTRSVFDAYIGQGFVLKAGEGQEIPVYLAQVERLGKPAEACESGGGSATSSPRESFSLLFRAPKDWRGPQRIYTVAHHELGKLDMFLVPIGPDEQGMRLEAIFNFSS